MPSHPVTPEFHKASADVLRRLADIVESGEYYKIEHTPATINYLSGRPASIRHTYVVEVEEYPEAST